MVAKKRARPRKPTRARKPAPTRTRTRTRKAIDWMDERIIPGVGVAALLAVGSFIVFTYQDVAPRAEVITRDAAIAKVSADADAEQRQQQEATGKTIERILDLQDTQIALNCQRRTIGKDPDFDDYCRAYYQGKARGE